MTRTIKPFGYCEAKDINEAMSYLDTHRGVKLIAGGTDLIVQMKKRMKQPTSLVSIAQTQGLDEINNGGKGLRIGALTTLRSIESSPLVKKHFPILSECVSQMATTQVRNMATIGGNICNASPAADAAVALLALDAKFHLISQSGRRIIRAEDFFLGPGKSILKPSEILTEIEISNISPKTGGAFIKISRVSNDLAIINVATVLSFSGNVCEDAKIALGAVAPTPIRAKEAEEALKGRIISPTVIGTAEDLAADTITPITDVRGTAEYRRAVSKVIVRRSIETASYRAGKGG